MHYALFVWVFYSSHIFDIDSSAPPSLASLYIWPSYKRPISHIFKGVFYFILFSWCILHISI